MNQYIHANYSFYRIIQSKIAPQKLQRRCRRPRQQRIPTGKQHIAQQIPKVVNSLSNMPTLQTGHPPTTITVGGCCCCSGSYGRGAVTTGPINVP